MKTIILLLCALVTACTASPATPLRDLPPDVQLSADAITARQTSDAALFAAQQAQANANAARAKAEQYSAQQTAIAQATRDAAAYESTRVALDLQIAQVTRQAQHDMATATESARRVNIANAETSQARSETRAAVQTQTRRADDAAMLAASQTRQAAYPTQTRQAEQVAEAQVERERASRVAAMQAEWDANTKPVVNFLAWTVLPFAFICALSLLVLFGLWKLFRAFEEYIRAKSLEVSAPALAKMLIRDATGRPIGFLHFQNGAATFQPYSGMGEGVPQLPAGNQSGNEPKQLAARTVLLSKRLNLAEQPHGWSLPIGVTAQGDKWIPLARAGHLLIGGPTGSGKTYLVHAIIQALLHGGMAELVLFDGKQGLEFSRYASEPKVTLVDGDELDRVLAGALGDMAARFDKMLSIGVREIERFNVVSDEPLARKVIVIDELKSISAGALTHVLSLMRMGRAAGVHIILATQFPDAKSVPIDVRGNATTRIAFAVATHHESTAILGTSGAEDLPRLPGRLLLECFGERSEAQAFAVDLPDVPIITVPPSPFSDLEKKMIQLAVSDGGWFKVRRIARALGIDDSTVTDTAEAWERRGWVSKERYNVGRPGKNGRELLPPLLDLAKRHGVSMSPHVAQGGHSAHVAMSPMSPAN